MLWRTFHCWLLNSAVCYTVIISSGRRIKKKKKPLCYYCSCFYQATKVAGKKIIYTHTCKIRETSCFIARFKISSISRKEKCYNTQLDEQLRTKIHSVAVLEFEKYHIQWSLRRRTSLLLLFSKSLNYHVAFMWRTFPKAGIKKFLIYHPKVLQAL